MVVELWKYPLLDAASDRKQVGACSVLAWLCGAGRPERALMYAPHQGVVGAGKMGCEDLPTLAVSRVNIHANFQCHINIQGNNCYASSTCHNKQ
jgi:hypothetical protein